jgi:signal transduction histidine kinase
VTDLGTTAGGRTEVTLAWTSAGFRAGAVVALLAASGAQFRGGTATAPQAVLTLVVIADCVLFSAVCLRRGRIPPVWAATDLICVVAAVGLSSWPALQHGTPGQSHFYNFSVIAAPTLGLPAWRPLVGVAGSAALAFMDFFPALRAGSTYPRWNALPDALTVVGIAALAAVLARLLRESAAALDRHGQLTVERAAVLARHRERLRQHADLSAHLMTTLEALTAQGAVADPVIADRLRVEAGELRRLIAAEQPSGGGLVPRLREVVAQKEAVGLRVDFAPDEAVSGLVGGLVEPAVDAVVAAAGEALTNVAKHSGMDQAAVSVAVVADRVAVTIIDRGRGYDPAATAEGFGQRRSLRQRVEAVGGQVEIESAPGSGTRVELWVPLAGSADSADGQDTEP